MIFKILLKLSVREGVPIYKNDKHFIILFLVLMAGVVLGGFIGEYIGGFPYMVFLRYGRDFGFTKPLELDLGIKKLQFSILIKFSIAGLIGIIIAIFAYRKL